MSLSSKAFAEFAPTWLANVTLLAGYRIKGEHVSGHRPVPSFLFCPKTWNEKPKPKPTGACVLGEQTDSFNLN